MSLLNQTDECKKRKRGDQKAFRFKSFGENGYPVEFDGSFRHNVNALLEYGHLERDLCIGMPIWSFQLQVHRHPPFHILLFVVEEPIEASSLNLHCNHCQYVGWGHHMICNKKYHFLIPSKDTMAAWLSCEGSYDPEKGKSSNLAELKGHIMHGVFHSNGFGHLLCVNGVEAGSDFTGHQIMEFWDRLCTGMRARKVSLNDTSQMRGMELRLLHGVAYSESWFGRWGYKFGSGTYGITQQVYQKAIEAIQGMPLGLITNHLANSNHDHNIIPPILLRYQTLSDHSLVTLGNLFRFMFELKSRLPKEKCMDFHSPGILEETNCRWSRKRIEMATRVIVEALKTAEFKWVSRQEVRDTARAYIGDTGLLDFVLKSLGNQIVGSYLVRRSLNPVTKILEYCLEDISNVFNPNYQEGNLVLKNPCKVKAQYKITKAQLMKDIFYLYKCILKDEKATMSTGMFNAIPVATSIILDTKYFVKEYYGEISTEVEGKLMLLCTVMLRNHDEVDGGIKQPILPYECITLQNNATIDELILEVERNFREIYWGLRSFVVKSIVNLNVAQGTDLVEINQKIVFEGSMNDEVDVYESDLKCRTSVVDCPCGAKDDDGERMVSCDICEVWQHTRCVCIPNNEDIPHIFLCNRCEQEILPLSSLP